MDQFTITTSSVTNLFRIFGIFEMDPLNRVEGSVDDQRKIRRTNLKSAKGEVYIFTSAPFFFQDIQMVSTFILELTALLPLFSIKCQRFHFQVKRKRKIFQKENITMHFMFSNFEYLYHKYQPLIRQKLIFPSLNFEKHTYVEQHNTL